MTAWMRKAVLALMVMLATTPALAAGKAESTEAFVKLPSIVLEFWGADGIFHAVNMDLSVVFPSQTSLNKSVADKLSRAFTAMTWEDFSKDNPATTVKAMALDIVRKEPGGEKASEVLILKLMLR